MVVKESGIKDEEPHDGDDVDGDLGALVKV